jgi:hypothetical protein
VLLVIPAHAGVHDSQDWRGAPPACDGVEAKVTNPFNHEAGSTPAPVSVGERALVERSAAVIWRAFPYFAWRYAERGRMFGKSDAGYLATLLDHNESTSRAQVTWLVSVLAPRGMPSIVLEYQLENLGRLWRKAGLHDSARFTGHAAELRDARLAALEPETFAFCERICAAAARRDPRRRGTGMLIAAAVADSAAGIGDHDEALVKWFSDAVAGDWAWADACAHAREVAHRELHVVGSSSR